MVHQLLYISYSFKFTAQEICQNYNYTNNSYLEHTDPLFKQTKLLKLNDITKFATATYMYNNKNHIHSLLPLHECITRHRNHLTLPIHRLSKFQHSTTYLAPVVWNSIPLQIKDTPSLNTLKQCLRKHILFSYYLISGKSDVP